MPRSRIHVRRDIIAADKKHGTTGGLAIGVETLGMRKRYGRAVEIRGNARVIYSPDKPLKCGARAWIETYSPVVVHRS